ncbi:MAG: phosphatidate cytidylyltransferase [Gemmatimonadota bacterium]|nr:phosphatidate cytidylyltransferase [Gemmatimonadota bacterium]
MSELAKRVLASVVLVPVTLASGWYGDWALAALLSIAAAISSWELFRIAREGGVEPFVMLGVPIAAIVPLVIHARYRGVFTLGVTSASIAFLIILAMCIWLRGPTQRPLAVAAVTVFGIIYTGGMLSFAYAIRYHPYTVGAAGGATLLLFPLLLTWTTDTGAYFVGRSIGRRKLIPSVSPGKSVEGALGGLALALLIAWLFERMVLIPVANIAFAPGAVLLFGAAISVAAQVGDLAESLLKREAGVKDSSRIIPGHGGVFDRLDSLLFVLPTAYWLLSVLRLVPVPG